MSRVCVKNVPRYVTEERLREFFAVKGEVTDAKIIRTRDGRSRQFGFVGFRTEEEAQDAANYFNRSYFDNSRLSCEIAQPIGDPSLPRPWSRHSQGSSAYQNSHQALEGREDVPAKENASNKKKTSEFQGINREAEDPQLLEFMQVMLPRSKTKLWANDTSVDPVRHSKKQDASGKAKSGTETGARVEKESVDGVLRRVPVGKGKSEQKLTRVHVHFEDGSDDEADDVNGATSIPEAMFVLEESVNDSSVNIRKEDALLKDYSVSDMEYLKHRTTHHWSSDDDADDDDDDGGGSGGGGDNDNNNLSLSKPHKEISPESTRDDKNVDNICKSSVKDSYVELSSAGDTELQPNKFLVEGASQKPFNSAAYKPLQVTGACEPRVADDLENVAETGRLFVRNLPYTASEEDLAKLFSMYGELSQVHLVLDKETKRSKGFAYVLFMLPENASRAMEGLDKSIFQGRLLHIIPAKRPPLSDKEARDGGGKSVFKQEREAQRRSLEASGNIKAWNTFFMRQDTIVENVAHQYGLPKSEFLDPEAEDLAVRLALGETHILAETKKALGKEGVNVDVLEDLASGKLKEVTRSGNVILVKNLPYTTSETELITLFGGYGSLGRIILPPTKTLALIEFLETAEAHKAFKGLAYKRFKHVPLYLEWAPDNLLGEKGFAKESDQTEMQHARKHHLNLVVEQQLVAPLIDEDELDPVQARSIFVKNLNFNTTEESLRKHIEKHVPHGSVRNVTIKSKPSKGGKALSMGFGFIEFDNMETAKDVSHRLQGTVVDDHSLLLQLSHGVRKGTDRNLATSKIITKAHKDQSSTKIIVRNVAFEATVKDLRQLFLPFGQLKSVRIPKKFDGSHRGFAFVEFLTKQEAENAFEALMSTHLYGRHMVLEWAREGESLDDLRAKTSSQFYDQREETTSRPSRRRKRTSIDDRDLPLIGS